MRGWVYVCSNKAMPGLLKIGFTLKDPFIRARELEQTGVPHPFVVEYEVMVAGPRDLERRVHTHLAGVHERKEWFRCTLSHAITAIRELAGGVVLLENVRNVDFRHIESAPVTTVVPQREVSSQNGSNSQ
jgi:T5orf172 domain